MQKTLSQHGAAIPAAERDEAEAAIVAVRAAMETGDHDLLTQATERMLAAEIKLETAAHEAASTAGGAPGGDKPGRPSEKVVDAEFEDVAAH